MSAPATMSESIAASIEQTLDREAQRNELGLAWVRAGAMLGLAATEVWFQLGTGGVPFPYRLPTYVYAVLSLALLGWLWRGGHQPRALRVLIPIADGLFILVRLQMAFSFHAVEGLERSMELATVALGAALLMVSGGFRLSRASLIATTCTGIGLYVWFALQTRLGADQQAVHLVLLAAIAVAMSQLTRQVRRAVRSEVARVTLSRFLPDGLVDSAHADPLALVTRPRAVQATVLISDIRGFTQWAEDRAPLEVLTALNGIQGRLASIVRDHHGMVDKFMGDGMLAVFGVPDARPDHARLALAAAHEMQRAVRELAEGQGGGFRIGIGVHTGELVVGVLGSGLRMEFTVLGDTVNTASRIEALTKQHSVPLLVSDATAGAAGPDHGLRRLGDEVLRGRTTPIGLWTSQADPLDQPTT